MRKITSMSLVEYEEAEAGVGAVESYSTAGDVATRSVRRRNGDVVSSTVARTLPSPGGGAAYSDFWQAWLRGSPPPPVGAAPSITVADLFSGCGGLSVGIRE